MTVNVHGWGVCKKKWGGGEGGEEETGYRSWYPSEEEKGGESTNWALILHQFRYLSRCQVSQIQVSFLTYDPCTLCCFKLLGNPRPPLAPPRGNPAHKNWIQNLLEAKSFSKMYVMSW